jgi:hypothetical protein
MEVKGKEKCERKGEGEGLVSRAQYAKHRTGRVAGVGIAQPPPTGAHLWPPPSERRAHVGAGAVFYSFYGPLRRLILLAPRLARSRTSSHFLGRRARAPLAGFFAVRPAFVSFHLALLPFSFLSRLFLFSRRPVAVRYSAPPPRCCVAGARAPQGPFFHILIRFFVGSPGAFLNSAPAARLFARFSPAAAPAPSSRPLSARASSSLFCFPPPFAVSSMLASFARRRRAPRALAPARRSDYSASLASPRPLLARFAPRAPSLSRSAPRALCLARPRAARAPRARARHAGPSALRRARALSLRCSLSLAIFCLVPCPLQAAISRRGQGPPPRPPAEVAAPISSTPPPPTEKNGMVEVSRAKVVAPGPPRRSSLRAARRNAKKTKNKNIRKLTGRGAKSPKRRNEQPVAGPPMRSGRPPPTARHPNRARASPQEAARSPQLAQQWPATSTCSPPTAAHSPQPQAYYVYRRMRFFRQPQD